MTESTPLNNQQSLRPHFSFLALTALHIAPALLTLMTFKLFALWAVGAVLFSIALQFFMSTRLPARKTAAAALSAALALGSACLYTSLVFQGSGFNEQFFLHFNLETLKVSLEQYLPLLLASIVYIALCGFAAAALKPFSWQKNKAGFSAVIAGLAAAVTLSPLTSAAEYLLTKDNTIEVSVQPVSRNRAPVIVKANTAPLKNIVLVYAEGLEATYLNDDIFPGLMPRLNALRSQAVDFTNVNQVMNTKWTIAGIVASQCSIPFNVGRIYGEANVALASIEKPFGQELCLGDILKAYGYDTTFVGGAGLAFAGKGKFLKTHGYDNLLGRTALSKRQADKEYVTGWGLYDDELVEFLSDEITAKNQAQTGNETKTPYMITALTLDTHQPAGHPSKSCKPFPDNDNPMLDSVYCSDQILGQFIEESLKDENIKDTIYVLFSDHLSNRNTVYETLQSNEAERRLLFMSWGGGLTPAVRTEPLTHFDVAPTILDWAGIPNYHDHNWGRSVTRPRPGLWYAGGENVQASAQNVTYINDADGFDDVKITLDPIVFDVGGEIYKASYAGDTLKDRIYVVLFSEEGDVESIGFYGEKKYLDEAKVDNWFIAVSGAPSIGHFTDEEAQSHPEGALYYYMGRVGSENPVTGFIEDELNLSAKQIEAYIQATSIHNAAATD